FQSRGLLLRQGQLQSGQAGIPTGRAEVRQRLTEAAGLPLTPTDRETPGNRSAPAPEPPPGDSARCPPAGRYRARQSIPDTGLPCGPRKSDPPPHRLPASAPPCAAWPRPTAHGAPAARPYSESAGASPRG